jgi:hypothetical protein
MAAEISVQNMGQNSARGRILYFHVRYSNRNISSSWYRNQAIRKPKFIYVCRTTTFTKDSRWDIIVLLDRIGPQNWSVKMVSWSDSKTDECRASRYDWEYPKNEPEKLWWQQKFQCKTWVKILLAAEFSTFTSDIQTGISRAPDIEIKQFESLNSPIRSGLRLSRRIPGEL